MFHARARRLLPDQTLRCPPECGRGVMDPVAIERVCLWFDPSAATRAAFAYALDWASYLNVPVQIVRPCQARTDPSSRGLSRSELEGCAAACTASDIPCDALEFGQESASVEQLFSTHAISVFSAALAPRIKNDLLRRSVRARQNAVLVCPSTWQPASRVLIL